LEYIFEMIGLCCANEPHRKPRNNDANEIKSNCSHYEADLKILPQLRLP